MTYEEFLVYNRRNKGKVSALRIKKIVGDGVIVTEVNNLNIGYLSTGFLVSGVAKGTCTLTNPSMLKNWKGFVADVWCDNLSQDEWNEKYDGTSKMDYLHGLCHEYALKKGTKDDYYIVWTRWLDEIEAECLLHCFIGTKDGKYKDVRGTTIHRQKVYEGFEDWDILSEYQFAIKEELGKWLVTRKIMTVQEYNDCVKTS